MNNQPKIQTLALRVPDLNISAGGVEPFYYPVSPSESRSAFFVFVDAFNEYLRRNPPEAGSVSEALWMMFPVLTLDVMRAHHAVVLGNRCSLAGYIPQDSWYQSLGSGDLPEISRRLAIAMNRPPSAPLWRKSARGIRALIRGIGYSKILHGSVRSSRELPVTFHRSPLLDRYATEKQLQPILSHPEAWLLPGEKINVSGSEVDSILSPLFRKVLEASSPEDSAIPLAWLLRSGNFSWAWGAAQLAHLRRRRDIPKQFWAGTLGNPVYRVMSKVVRERGGTVTGFDHGMSTGLWVTPIQTIFEFDFVDRFVTYSEAMTDGLRANWQPSRVINNQLPEIVGIPPVKEKQGVERIKRAPVTGKKIIYVPTVYSGDATHILPFFSDVQLVDWQVRLLSFLREKGWQAVIKPHPDSVYSMPDELLESVNGRVLSGRFENIDLTGSILMFDYPQTTAFVSALRSDQPIVVINFDRLQIQPAVIPLLEARCALVSGTMEKNGRLNVNWLDMLEALETSRARTDKTIAEKYFSGL